MTKKYYQALEIEENATLNEIKKAYHKLSLRWHPDSYDRNSINHPAKDKEEAEKKFKEINEAYTFLSGNSFNSEANKGENVSERKKSDREFIRKCDERIREIHEELRKIDERKKKEEAEREKRWQKHKKQQEEQALETKKIFQKIKENPNDWKIEGEKLDEKVINKNGQYRHTIRLENDLEEAELLKWLKIREIIMNNQKREEVIQELQEKKLIDCEKINHLERSNFSMDYSKLNDEEKKELSKTIFENLKKNKEGWNIKKIITSDYCGREDYQTKELLIIHNSAQLNYDKHQELIYDRTKMWEKNFFSQEQWKELEEIIPFSNEKQTETKLINNNFPWGKAIIIGGIVAAIIVLILFWKKIKILLS